MSIRVSVIIPTYKSAPWITATLESLLQQTFPREQLELILIDDASPDDGAQVARNVLEGSGLKHQIIMREKNCGVTTNRNFGWRMAEGDWIQFLDQDDLLMPHKLALQYGYASNAPSEVGVVYSSWRSLELVDGSWQPNGPIQAPWVDDDTVVRILRDWTFGYVGPTLIRRAALEKVNGFEERPNLGEDTNLMLRMAMAGVVFRQAKSDGPAFLYRQTPGSLWKVYIKNLVALGNLIDTYFVTEDFLRKQPGGLSEQAREALALRYGRFAGFFLAQQPAMYDELERHIKGLGMDYPPGLSRGMEAAARLLGYRNALRLRAKLRSMRGMDPD